MTNIRAKALAALEKTIDLVDHDSDEPIPTPFKNFLSAEVYETIKDALSEPKWKSMDIERVENMLEDICSIACDTRIRKETMRRNIRANCVCISNIIIPPSPTGEES